MPKEWNAYFYWHDRPVQEWVIAANVLEAAGVEIVDLVSRHQSEQPPACEAKLDGQFSGIEVTELLHQSTVKRSIRAIRERAAGKEPKRPEEFFDWDRDDLLSALLARIDRKQRRWQGGPYQRRVLVMCTNEFFLDRIKVERFLQGLHFKTGFLPMCFSGCRMMRGALQYFILPVRMAAEC